jgi:hypothetical protein
MSRKRIEDKPHRPGLAFADIAALWVTLTITVAVSGADDWKASGA